MREAFERTVAYLKERVQFDVPIGSFQALQHRAARLYVEIELLAVAWPQRSPAKMKPAPTQPHCPAWPRRAPPT
jgi:alkylation response protein AidB-like acyl-CoA dehydrogenase